MSRRVVKQSWLPGKQNKTVPALGSVGTEAFFVCLHEEWLFLYLLFKVQCNYVPYFIHIQQREKYSATVHQISQPLMLTGETFGFFSPSVIRQKCFIYLFFYTQRFFKRRLKKLKPSAGCLVLQLCKTTSLFQRRTNAPSNLLGVTPSHSEKPAASPGRLRRNLWLMVLLAPPSLNRARYDKKQRSFHFNEYFTECWPDGLALLARGDGEIWPPHQPPLCLARRSDNILIPPSAYAYSPVRLKNSRRMQNIPVSSSSSSAFRSFSSFMHFLIITGVILRAVYA